MKRVSVLGMKVRLSTVAVSAALILFILGAWIYSALRPEPAAPTVALPTATPEPTATATPTAAPEPTATAAPTATPEAAEPTPVGDWQSGYYAMAGLAVLKACHGFAGMVGSTTDVKKDMVDRMIAAYPGKGDFLAVARAFVPRTGDPAADLEAWLNSVIADCSRSPWTEEALKAITESGKNSLIGHAILRPVTTPDGKDAWEYVVYVMP